MYHLGGGDSLMYSSISSNSAGFRVPTEAGVTISQSTTGDIYAIIFSYAPMIKRPSADIETKCICIRSNNAQHEPQVCAAEDLTLCGRAKARLAVKEY